ncbi:MAG: hypothetical protein H8D80_01855 [Proteobacteria bacterium]|nr:hypothetical protein [Pseudomonadota bacterium]
MGSANQSSRAYIGVGPRHCFTFTGTAGEGVTQMTVDTLLGSGITATYTGQGEYTIEHGLGNSACAAFFQTEINEGAIVNISARGITNIQIQIENGSDGSRLNPAFIHGTIHDGGG